MAAAPDAAPSADARAAGSAGSLDLRTLLRDGAAHADITHHLDALDAHERLRQMLAVKGKWLKALYERMEAGPTFTLEELAPPDSVGKTLIYEGRNSLALFTRFQKRFLRTQSGVIVGYNHQLMQWLTGPGYFVVQAPDGKPPVPNEPYVDYITEPPEIPQGWPTYKPNSRGLSKLVYGGMHDYLRRVATNVAVGRAFLGDKDRNAYFSLTLQPPVTALARAS
jgi:hypothetical protein